MELISQNLPYDSGSVLDIGSNWGYCCHGFQALGYNCTAVESSPLNLYFLKKLRRAENREFEVIDGSILGINQNMNYDITLALNIFHHFIKTQDTYERFVNWLRHLETKVLFFQPHSYHEPQMNGSLRNFKPEDFVRFIREKGGFRTSKQIGIADDNRLIFMMTT
jgi:cyclopropane fatty-acyl-phospholipid synthase-like methyltransferase